MRTGKNPALFLGRSADLRHAAYVIVRAPITDECHLRTFVEDCLRKKVKLIAPVGPHARQIEHAIDQIIVGKGSDRTRFLATSAHASKRDALEFIWALRTLDEHKIGRKQAWYEVHV